MDALAEIKNLYYKTSRATVARDLVRAIALLKTIGSEEDREKAAVFMDGLSQMRSEWAAAPGAAPKAPKAAPRKP